MEVFINDIKLSLHTAQNILDEIGKAIQFRKRICIFSGNIHSFNFASRFGWFKKLLNDSEIVRNDSSGLQLACRLLRVPVPDRNTWADFGWQLADYCSKYGYTLFFLGGTEGTAQRAADKIKKKLPGVKILGTMHGYFDKQGIENESVVSMINNLSPNILLVGFGMPIQEAWIRNNKIKLNVNAIMTCGNCFAYLAGLEKRAPKFIRMIGMEWLFRFLMEPKRLFNRYMRGIPYFYLNLIKSRNIH